MNNAISNMDDVIDSCDVIARIEELQGERDSFVIGAPDGTETESPEQWAVENAEDAEELKTLEALQDELSGYCDDWTYGVTLIRYSYFRDYAMELAEELSGENTPTRWPFTCIDWDKAARELQMDYTSGEFDGITYWAR